MDGLGTFQGNFRNKKIELKNGVAFRCFIPTLSVKLSSNSTESRTESNIFVDVYGESGTAGIVTLTGLEIEPMMAPVAIGGSGHTRTTFTFFAQGSYTVKVEIGGDTVEESIAV